MKSGLKFYLLVLFVLSGFMALSQSEMRIDVPPFKKVSVTSGIDLFLNHSSSVGLVVKGEQRVIKRVVCRVEGDHLFISLVGTITWSRSRSVEVYLDFTELDQITATSGSDVRCESVIKSPILDVRGKSGSDIYLPIEVKSLKMIMSSGCNISLVGQADHVKASIASGSNLKAHKLLTRKMIIDVSGGGDAYVFATHELHADASGGSTIRYKGNPVIKNIKSSSGGEVLNDE